MKPLTFPDNFEKPSFRSLLFALSSNITIIISIITFFFLFEAFIIVISSVFMIVICRQFSFVHKKNVHRVYILIFIFFNLQIVYE